VANTIVARIFKYVDWDILANIYARLDKQCLDSKEV